VTVGSAGEIVDMSKWAVQFSDNGTAHIGSEVSYTLITAYVKYERAVTTNRSASQRKGLGKTGL
jgi:hypothetical protein